MLLAIAFLVVLLVALSEGLPDLIEGISQLGDFFAMVLRVALVTIAKIIWFLLKPTLRLGWRGLCLGVTFLYFFAAELLRGQTHESEDEEDEDGEEDQDETDLCAAARTLLGLPENFTRAALDAAYKRAIKKAHPDAGGTVDDAQAINMARDLLLRRLGTV